MDSTAKEYLKKIIKVAIKVFKVYNRLRDSNDIMPIHQIHIDLLEELNKENPRDEVLAILFDMLEVYTNASYSQKKYKPGGLEHKNSNCEPIILKNVD